MKDKDFKNPGNENGESSLSDKENDTTININADSDVAGTSYLKEFSQDSESEKMQDEVAELKDKYIRLVAEFDNFRKRTAREKLELIQTASKDVIISLLDVLDDCDRAQKQMENSDDIAAIKEGVLLVFNKLRTTFQTKGVKVMVSINQPFDPDLHEAITEIPAPRAELKGKVLDEVQKGYYLNDKIIRFAKVVVGK
ncbi:MAG: nucleotide exchange factor GrpE [Chitinophagaceae bacterium]